MEQVPILVEGITDKSFLERIPRLEKDRLDFGRHQPMGQDKAKENFASLIRTGIKAVLCLDIDDKSPEAKFAEVKEFLEKQGIPISSTDAGTGSLSTEGGEVLFVPFGLWGDKDLAALHVTRHSFEDYLIKIAIDDPSLSLPDIAHSVRDCLGQVVAEYARKGCASLSSGQVYQLLKPFVGLPKHETGAIRQLLRNANQDITRETTRPLVERLNSFLAGVVQND